MEVKSQEESESGSNFIHAFIGICWIPKRDLTTLSRPNLMLFEKFLLITTLSKKDLNGRYP